MDTWCLAQGESLGKECPPKSLSLSIYYCRLSWFKFSYCPMAACLISKYKELYCGFVCVIKETWAIPPFYLQSMTGYASKMCLQIYQLERWTLWADVDFKINSALWGFKHCTGDMVPGPGGVHGQEAWWCQVAFITLRNYFSVVFVWFYIIAVGLQQYKIRYKWGKNKK